jgi:GTP-binding protein
VKKRLVAAQGGNGAGSWKHGRKGLDLIVQVPVGTVVKEVRREAEEDRIAKEEELLGLTEEDRKKRRRERMFVKHPMGEIQDEDYEDAEMTLQREGRYSRSRTHKSIDVVESIELDISRALSEPLLLSAGGTGGLGNPHFHVPSSGNAPTLPRLASRGHTPPTLTLSFELKLLADVGLVGFPNAGKSTLLRALTGSKAEVAGYQFTTLNPQVGVVRVWDDGTYGGVVGGIVEESWKERAAAALSDAPRAKRERKVESMRFTISDNPGLLPEAHQNYGLGHSFLRSIERSLALCYVLDLTRADPGSDLRALVRELEEYKAGLGAKSRVVVVNKADEVDETTGRERLSGVREAIEEIKGDHAVDLVTVSGKYGLGLENVVSILAKHVSEARAIQAQEEADKWAGLA